MSRGEQFICWVMAILVATAPLPFGSVEPIAAAFLQICLVLLAIVWVIMRTGAGLPALPWSDPFLIGGGALLGYGILQMTPLPFAMIEQLSPATAALKSAYSPEIPVRTTLSLDPHATWMSCLRLTCWVLAALLLRHITVTRRARLTIAGGLVAGGLFQAGYGLFEFISGRQHIFGYAKTVYADVATGTFINRNSYAGFLEMAIPMALAVAATQFGGSAESTAPRRPAGGWWLPMKRRLAGATGRQSFGAIISLMGAFLMATALMMSRSRMGIISMAAALGVGGLLLALGKRSRRFAFVSIGVVLVAGLFASQIDFMPIVDRFSALRDEFGTGYGRLQVWQAAIPLVAANPVFGTGFGTWETAFSPFRTDQTQVRVDFAHNDYLEFLAEGGGIGAAILLFSFWLAMRRRWNESDASGSRDEITLAAGIGFAAIALHSMTDFHFSIPANAFCAAILAGLSLRIERQQPLPARQPGKTAHVVRIVGGATCTVVLAVTAMAAVPPALAQARSLVSTPAGEATLDDRTDLDTEPVDSTAASPDDTLCPECGDDPGNAGIYFDAAKRSRLRLLSDVAAILRAQQEGIVPDPVVRVYLAGRIDATIELARHGLSLAPVTGSGHLEIALLHFGRYQLVGLPPKASADFESSLKSFDRALRLQPWFSAPHRKAARLLAPHYDSSTRSQREFIARVTRRAFELNPWAADLRESAERMAPR